MSRFLPEPDAVPKAPKLVLRLDFSATFWRLAATIFVVRECWVWYRTLRFPAWPTIKRVFKVVQKVPESVLVAGVSAFCAAVVVVLIVRWLTQPRMLYWLQPREEDSFAMPYAFRLGGSERVEAEWPARRLEGRAWRPGTLVLTNQRLGFFPFAYDSEPWTAARKDLAAGLSTVPAPAMSWGLVSGLPDHLVFWADDAAAPETFALLEPASVLKRVGARRPVEAPTLERVTPEEAYL